MLNCGNCSLSTVLQSNYKIFAFSQDLCYLEKASTESRGGRFVEHSVLLYLLFEINTSDNITKIGHMLSGRVPHLFNHGMFCSDYIYTACFVALCRNMGDPTCFTDLWIRVWQCRVFLLLASNAPLRSVRRVKHVQSWVWGFCCVHSQTCLFMKKQPKGKTIER